MGEARIYEDIQDYAAAKDLFQEVREYRLATAVRRPFERS